jgi:hypothetical protein
MERSLLLGGICDSRRMAVRAFTQLRSLSFYSIERYVT